MAPTEAPTRGFPSFVSTEQDRQRWTMCEAIAADFLDEPVDHPNVWLTARALYRSDLPTDA